MGRSWRAALAIAVLCCMGLPAHADIATLFGWGASLPSSCAEPQLFFDTSAATGQKLYGCESGTFVLQGGLGGCTSDGAGNLTCTSVSTSDRTTTPGNTFTLLDNDTGTLDPAPSCADNSAGVFSIRDVDDSSADNWVVCDGTSQAFDFNAPTAASITGTQHYDVSWKSPATGDDAYVKVDKASTITAFVCLSTGSTNPSSALFTVYECTTAGASCATTGATQTLTGTNPVQGTEDTSFTDSAIADEAWLKFEPTSGTLPSYAHCRLEYTQP